MNNQRFAFDHGLTVEQIAGELPIGWLCISFDESGKEKSRCIAMNKQETSNSKLKIVIPLVAKCDLYE